MFYLPFHQQNLCTAVFSLLLCSYLLSALHQISEEHPSDIQITLISFYFLSNMSQFIMESSSGVPQHGFSKFYD